MGKKKGQLVKLPTPPGMRRSPRKPSPRRHSDQDSWTVTYADLLTLLLCFFTILLSVSKIDVAKMDALQAQVSEQFGAPGAQVEGLSALQARIQKVVEEAALKDNVRVRRSEQGLEIDLNAKILFETAKADLDEDAFHILDLLMSPIAALPITVSVEGHTDPIPIANDDFASNWELSAARATGVVHHLIEAHHYAPERLRAVGLADTKPIAEDGTPLAEPLTGDQRTAEYLARQRRVTLILTPLSRLPIPQQSEQEPVQAGI